MHCHGKLTRGQVTGAHLEKLGGMKTMTRTQLFLWGLMESSRQFAEADSERVPAEQEPNPFLSQSAEDLQAEQAHIDALQAEFDAANNNEDGRLKKMFL